MTLQLIPSEFPYILWKFYFLFYQCTHLTSESTKMIQPLTLLIHTLSLWGHSDGSLWGRNGDSLTYPPRAQLWSTRLSSEITPSLTLWGYSEYPVIHSLTLHTKRAQWWITHLAPQKWFTSLPSVGIMMIHSLTLWVQRLMKSLTLWMREVMQHTYPWIY